MRCWFAAFALVTLVVGACALPDEITTAVVETPRPGLDGLLATAPQPPEACLSLPGGTTTPVSGGTSLPPAFVLQSNDKLDATNAQFSVPDPMTDQNNHGFFRIVLVSSATDTDNNGCWSGGEILGQYAPSTLWATWQNELTNVLDHGMHDKYGLLVGNNQYASGLRIDNVFIFNYGDGISFDNVTSYPTANDFTIRNVHMKYIRDDCIENDSYLGGTIDRAFLDGCYSGVSAQSGRSATSHTITMSHSLVRLQSMDVVYKSAADGSDSSQAGPRHNWFWKWSPNAPKLKLYNNVFRVDGWQPGNENDHLVPLESMFTEPPECENNKIVWLGSGSFPEQLPFPNQQNPPCFEVTTDVSVWNNAVTNWQNLHGMPSGAAKPIVSMFPARQPYYWPSPTEPYRGTQTVIATAVDDRVVSSVRFQIDNKDIGTVTQTDASGDGSTGPTKYNLSWDSRYYADGTLVANGSHMLKAIARDDQNQETTSAEVPVTVSNPVASFTFSCTQLACSFTSTSSVPNGTIASYAWTFGDGGASTLQNPSHTYAANGTYTVTLTVTDDGGAASAPKSTPVTVSAPLSATIAGPHTVGHSEYCPWTANVTGGVPPYSYNWTASWTTPGSSYVMYAFTSGQGTATPTGWGYYNWDGFSPNPTPIDVQVQVTDAEENSYTAESSVDLYSYGYGCSY